MFFIHTHLIMFKLKAHNFKHFQTQQKLYINNYLNHINTNHNYKNCKNSEDNMLKF